MSACKRMLTRAQIIEGLKKGRFLYVDRKDAPELIDLTILEIQGNVKFVLEEFPEQQYSRRKYWWIGPK